VPAAELARKIARVRRAASEHDRDPDSIAISVMGPALLAPNNERLQELLAAGAAFRNITVEELLEGLQKDGVPMGTPENAAPAIARLEELGVEKYYVQWLDLGDRRGIEELVSMAATMQTPDARRKTPAPS
jgi:alkanesulfonate monooxygenase SsuD/methylene tetrahydromethanopterin reductase-like flavin-dependent oxidoreductase (luciferase family)